MTDEDDRIVADETIGAQRACPACLTTTMLLQCPACSAETDQVDRVFPADERPIVGATLADKYHVEALIGRGAMGAVYRGLQLSMNRPVAIKIIAPRGGDAATLVARFRREASVTSKLSHPHSIRVFDFGHLEDGVMYLVMELLDGRDLRAMLDESGPLPLDQALRLCIQVLEALGEAHGLGVVHRDLKPGNIFILRGDRGLPFVKVLDFGLASARDDPALVGLTGTGAVVGTPAYMAPEQARSETPGGRADLYAVGILLFEMLTGRVPFQEPNLFELILRQIRDAPPRLADLAPHTYKLAQTQAALDMLLAKDPADRPKDAADATKLLRALLPPPPRRATAVLASADDRKTVPYDVIAAPEPESAKVKPQVAGGVTGEIPSSGGRTASDTALGVGQPGARPKRAKSRQPAVQTRLRFQLILSGNRSTKDANVRIWVDADEDGNMENSEQIGGVVSSGKSWRGSTEISRADAKGVPFLVRFHASPGTRWRLRVQSDRPRRHVVYEQSDRTQRAEERIIGWCGD